ncbi:tagaturonate reductase [Chryseobacterium koreense]|uniref:Altronate oxidoreductase n=1 Tax=Chryseobacterium koreense CCUG 49689 TaxID=1304281 RepID=A0A0J7IYJ4_9FLAO|nr:tagaturonate reductase [Chryseobacterium koreense]KMQ70906.1 altronate oxidoreductase [Chryseobacterium koreense CCUG 49689]MBB5332440.1 tagaturonate reductase [Chryseobacterium koreense]
METVTNTKLQLNRKDFGSGKTLPIKILQFGEGNFLRAFVDYAFHQLNQKLDYDAGVAAVQPLPGGMVEMLDEQDAMYTVFLNGVKNGKKIQEIHLVDNIVKTINPYKDFQSLLEVAKLDSLEFIISNTTEAGIEFVDTDVLSEDCPKSYPAKVAAVLYERFKHFKGDKDKGLTIIPCELINYNADTLKEILLQYCDLWKLEPEFATWMNDACTFHNTLVDRIVPGYPREEAESFGQRIDYHDKFMVAAEPFFLWVIEGDEKLKQKLPFDKIGLDVKIVSDMQPYRNRKVRILNGIHTAMVPFSIMYGNETVQETVENPFTMDFVSKIAFQEIVPTLDMDKTELLNFTEEVLDRFRNPFIRHQLSDIALNSVSKFKVRVLPTILEYFEQNGKLPYHLVFGFACLIRFYGKDWNGKKLPVKDSVDVVEAMNKAWLNADLNETVKEVLANEEFWGEDLNKVEGLQNAITVAIQNIDELGIEKGYESYVTHFA